MLPAPPRDRVARLAARRLGLVDGLLQRGHQVHQLPWPGRRLGGLRLLAVFLLGLDHRVQRLGVAVGELGAGEVVPGHGLDQCHGFVDLVFVQLDRRRDHGGGVADFVRPQQRVQGDHVPADS
ncbi:hypothetical protein TNCT6_77250 [Streptomyces sp. 6-11-2]|nr:hypothetical protein TNCT6_77250 [Streptomyces sp. 6-11-2]